MMMDCVRRCYKMRRPSCCQSLGTGHRVIMDTPRFYCDETINRENKFKYCLKIVRHSDGHTEKRSREVRYIKHAVPPPKDGNLK